MLLKDAEATARPQLPIELSCKRKGKFETARACSLTRLTDFTRVVLLQGVHAFGELMQEKVQSDQILLAISQLSAQLPTLFASPETSAALQLMSSSETLQEYVTLKKETGLRFSSDFLSCELRACAECCPT